MAVRFEIFRDGQKLTSFQPVGAVVLGPESIPIAGDVVFKDGILAANRGDEHAIGIALLWDENGKGAWIRCRCRRKRARDQKAIALLNHGMTDESRRAYLCNLCGEILFLIAWSRELNDLGLHALFFFSGLPAFCSRSIPA